MRKTLSPLGIMSLLLATVSCGGLKKDKPTTGINPSGQEIRSTDSLVTVGTENPFAGSHFFVDPAYAAKVRGTIPLAPDLGEKLEKIANTSTAYWVDRKGAISGLKTYLDAASNLATSLGSPVTATIVVYNLPDRDCAAAASNGELSGPNALVEYRAYIDELAAIVLSHSKVRIAAVVEPDSLPNIVTNQGQRKCTSEVLANYETGIVYAIEKLQADHVSLYLDIAHSGWLGWSGNRSGAAQVMARVLQKAGGNQKIRGFATNVANYSVLQFDSSRPSPWYDQSNPARDELTYVQLMRQDLSAVGITNPRFIIDTGRNGSQIARQVWGSWCNVANAAIGKYPQAEPMDGIDAFVWIKPPGDSDGTSDSSAARFDYMCRSGDSLTPAPEAGAWFPDALIKFLRNS